MPESSDQPDARAGRWLWRLLVLSVLLMGGTYRAASAEPGLFTGAAFLVLSTLLAASLAQTARVLAAVQGAARRRDTARAGDTDGELT